MKLNNILTSVLAGSLLLSACTYQSNSPSYMLKFSNNQHMVSSADHSDWSGKYDGLLPCDDCIGVKTELRLNPDFSYHLRETYLGHSTRTKLYEGSFEFSQTDPKMIVLDDQANQRKYSLDEDALEMRNFDGTEITTVLKPHYKMQKILN